MIKRISFAGLVVFYMMAGINHFLDPEFYYVLIPNYLPFPFWINVIAGVVEIAFSILLVQKSTRRWAVYGIIAMLIAFIPSHVYAIQMGSFDFYGQQVPSWVIWFRLIVIHPILILWAYWHRK